MSLNTGNAILSNAITVDGSYNVGIGGAAEAGWILKSTGNTKVSSGSGTTVLQVNDTSTGGKAWSLISAGAGNAHSVAAGTFYLRNSSDGVTALSVASGGNVGIGTTSPSTVSTYKVLEVTGPNTSTGGMIRTNISDNTIIGKFYTNSTGVWVSAETSHPLILETANTERIRIYSGGEIGIKGAAATEAAYALFTNEANTGYFNIYAGGSGTATKGMKLKVTNGSSTIDAMTITSGGSVLIGTASTLAGGSLCINGNLNFGGTAGGSYRITNYQAGYLAFDTDNTERMRITAQGYFKFSNDGTYYNATGTYNEIRQAAGSGEIIYGTATSGTYTGTLIALDASRAANTAFNFYSGNANGVAQFRVSGTGVIYAQNTSVQAISSDVNLKTDIVNYDKGLSEVLLMKPRYFKYKNNLDTTIAGFIAQEMDEAIPGSMVDGEPNKEGETFKTYQVDWHPLLVKAIQELNQTIQNQQQQINQLINK